MDDDGDGLCEVAGSFAGSRVMGSGRGKAVGVIASFHGFAGMALFSLIFAVRFETAIPMLVGLSRSVSEIEGKAGLPLGGSHTSLDVPHPR